jgi:hypothetical protein
MTLLRIRPMSEHFTWTILHSFGVKEGIGRRPPGVGDKWMRQRSRREAGEDEGLLGLLQVCTLSAQLTTWPWAK